jgi:hypothetical protein
MQAKVNSETYNWKPLLSYNVQLENMNSHSTNHRRTGEWCAAQKLHNTHHEIFLMHKFIEPNKGIACCQDNSFL